MKVISFDTEQAYLIAAGLRKSASVAWSTMYRGPILIHAGGASLGEMIVGTPLLQEVHDWFYDDVPLRNLAADDDVFFCPIRELNEQEQGELAFARYMAWRLERCEIQEDRGDIKPFLHGTAIVGKAILESAGGGELFFGGACLWQVPVIRLFRNPGLWDYQVPAMYRDEPFTLN